LLCLPVYLVINVIGYALLSYMDVIYDITRNFYFDSIPAYYTFLGVKVGLSMCAFGLKIGVVVGSVLLLCNPEPETGNDGREVKEIQPLIKSEK